MKRRAEPDHPTAVMFLSVLLSAASARKEEDRKRAATSASVPAAFIAMFRDVARFEGTFRYPLGHTYDICVTNQEAAA